MSRTRGSTAGRRRSKNLRSVLSEREITKSLLESFDVYGSRGYKLLQKMNGHDLTSNSLICLANSISDLLGIESPSRNYKRSHILMIKWFDENYDKIEPCSSMISLKFVE